jgi:hypothetical protein
MAVAEGLHEAVESLVLALVALRVAAEGGEMKHKPCPFCGRNGWPTLSKESDDYAVSIHCQGFPRCGAWGPVRKTERGAWDAWDKREGGKR